LGRFRRFGRFGKFQVKVKGEGEQRIVRAWSLRKENSNSSLFPVPCSLFPVPCSPFPVLHILVPFMIAPQVHKKHGDDSLFLYKYLQIPY
jgi:hypothetical protein